MTVDRLREIVDGNRLPHAIMLVEEEGYGALQLALWLAQYASCENRSGGEPCNTCPTCNKIRKLIHPDLHFIFPTNSRSDAFLPQWRELFLSDPYFSEHKLNSVLGIEDKISTINVAEAKNILLKANMRSYEGGNKYFIIWLPEKMTVEASNKLLKMIEEPYPGTYFFFITHSVEKVIKTISSRCSTFYLQPRTSQEDIEDQPFTPIVRTLLELAAKKDLTGLIELSEKVAAIGRERQKGFCLYYEKLLREILFYKKGLPDIVHIGDGEKAAVQSLAPILKDSFFEKSFLFCENARTAVERNANAKMVFLNFFNQIFLSI